MQEGAHHLGVLADGAQHVQALHVAAALPDGVDHGLTVEPRVDGVLHDAAAADALHDLVGVLRGALADPVLAHRDGKAL